MPADRDPVYFRYVRQVTFAQLEQEMQNDLDKVTNFPNDGGFTRSLLEKHNRQAISRLKEKLPMEPGDELWEWMGGEHPLAMAGGLEVLRNGERVAVVTRWVS